MDEDSKTVEQVADETDGSRRPYAPPQVVESTAFETLALACGKSNGVGLCGAFPNIS